MTNMITITQTVTTLAGQTVKTVATMPATPEATNAAMTIVGTMAKTSRQTRIIMAATAAVVVLGAIGWRVYQKHKAIAS